MILKNWSPQTFQLANWELFIFRYEDTIVGQFFGHTHQDEFEIFYDNDDSSRAIR